MCRQYNRVAPPSCPWLLEGRARARARACLTEASFVSPMGCTQCESVARKKSVGKWRNVGEGAERQL